MTPPGAGSSPGGPWLTVLALSLGGALGVNARHYLGRWIAHQAGTAFPWATFAINLSGAFAIGYLTIALSRWVHDPRARLFLLTGFLGGYTTFSTYAMETLLLLERGESVRALVYLLGSAGLGLLAVVLGVLLGRHWL